MHNKTMNDIVITAWNRCCVALHAEMFKPEEFIGLKGYAQTCYGI